MENHLSEAIKNKKVIKKELLQHYQLPKKTRAIMINQIQDAKLCNFICDACGEIGVVCLKEIPKNLLAGVDVVVSDAREKNIFLNTCFQEGVIPVLPQETEYSLQEFNPMKFEGNSFLFADAKPFLIFEKICRFLENSQYTGDQRVLLKNILKLSRSLKR